MRIKLKDFREAGPNWFAYDILPQVEVDDDGDEYIEIPEDGVKVFWAPRTSELGLRIAKALGV